MHASPAQEQLQRLGRARGAVQLSRLQTLAGVSTTPPVLPAVSLSRAGSAVPLRFSCIGFMIATNAGGAVAMGFKGVQFLSPVFRQGSMYIEL
ncbi:MAG: hypothetical protein JO244_11285 [Solirubrobacterales bacterium]|nr:hypothetical protein [Solirubrobacterales bacterium]